MAARIDVRSVVHDASRCHRTDGLGWVGLLKGARVIVAVNGVGAALSASVVAFKIRFTN
jgi:hypothetical protein